jgi:hypothetical protein
VMPGIQIRSPNARVRLSYCTFCINPSVTQCSVGVGALMTQSSFKLKSQTLAQAAASIVQLVRKRFDSPYAQMLKGHRDDCADAFGNIPLASIRTTAPETVPCIISVPYCRLWHSSRQYSKPTFPLLTSTAATTAIMSL